MATAGGLDYDISVSGNFDTQFKSFTAQAKELDKSVQSLGKALNQKTKSKSVDKSGSDAKKQEVTQAKKLNSELDEEELIHKKILSIEKQMITAQDQELIGLKAQLKVLRAIEKSKISSVISSSESLKSEKVKADAVTKTLAAEEKSLVTQQQIANVRNGEVKTVQELAKALGTSEASILKADSALRAQEDTLKRVRAQADENAKAAEKEANFRAALKAKNESNYAKESAEAKKASDKKLGLLQEEANAINKSRDSQAANYAKLFDLIESGDAKELTRKQVQTQKEYNSKVAMYTKLFNTQIGLAQQEANARNKIMDKNTAKAAKEELAARKEALRIQKQQEAQAKRIAAANNLVALAAARTAKHQKEQKIIANQISAADPRRIKTAEAIAKETGLSADKVREFRNETKKATNQANKLLLSFKQVLFTVIRFQIARQIFSFITESVKTMSEFNAELESAATGMAVLTASVGQVRDANGQLVGGIDAFNKSLEVSNTIMKQLRQDAAQTEATFEGLVQAYQVAVGPGLAAGLNLDEIRQSAVNLTRAATQLGVPVRGLSEEIRSVLSGTIKIQNTRLAPLFTNEDIRNATEQGQLFELINDKLKVYETSASAVADTFKVLSSNVEDAVKGILASGGIEYFESLKDLLREIRGILTADEGGMMVFNEDASQVVKNVAEGLKSFTESITDVVKSEENMEALLDITEAIGTAMGVAGSAFSAFVSGTLRGLQLIVTPINFVVTAFQKLTGLGEGKLGSFLEKGASFLITWYVTSQGIQKTWIVLKGTLGVMSTLLAITQKLTIGISASSAQRLGTETATVGAIAAQNGAYRITSRLMDILRVKTALMTGGVSLALGIVAVAFSDIVLASGEMLDGLEEFKDTAEQTAEEVEQIQKGFLELPISVTSAIKQSEKLNGVLEKTKDALKKISDDIDVEEAVSGLEGATREYVKAQFEALKIAERSTELERSKLKTIDTQIAKISKKTNLEGKGVEDLLKKNQELTSEITKQQALDKKAGTDATQTTLALVREKLAVEKEISRIVIRNGGEQVTAAKEALNNAKALQLGNKRQLQDSQASGSGDAVINFLKGEQAKLDQAAAIAQINLNNLVAKEVEVLQNLNVSRVRSVELNKLISESEAKIIELGNKKGEQILRNDAYEQDNLVTKKEALDAEVKALEQSAVRSKTVEQQNAAEEQLLNKRIELREAELDVLKDVQAKEQQALEGKITLAENDEIRLVFAEALSETQALHVQQLAAQNGLILSLIDKQGKLNSTIEAQEAADRSSELKTADQIASREAAIAKIRKDNESIGLRTDLRRLGLAKLAQQEQIRIVASTKLRTQSQIDQLIAEKEATTDLKKQEKIQRKINSLQAQRESKIDLERAKLEKINVELTEMSLNVSGGLSHGIRQGFEEFALGATGVAPIMTKVIEDGLNGVASTSGQIFSDFLDPRKNHDIENSFADMFYGLAGQAAEAFTRNILQTAIGDLFTSGADVSQTAAVTTNTSVVGLNTTALGVLNSTLAAAEASKAGVAGAEVLSNGTGEIGTGLGLKTDELTQVELGPDTVSREESQFKDQVGLDAQSNKSLLGTFQGLGGIFSSGFGGLLENAGDQSSLLGIVVSLLGSVLGGVWALLSPLLIVAWEAVKTSVTQAAILTWTILDTITPFAKGGMVKGFANGGDVGGGQQGLRSFQKAHNIPKSDTIAAMLTPGEFVLVPDAVKKYGAGFLNALNQGLIDPSALLGMSSSQAAVANGVGVRGYADGGMVGGAGNLPRVGSGSGGGGGIQILPVLVADNASMEQMQTGGRESFEKGVNKTTLTGERNKSKEWK